MKYIHCTRHYCFAWNRMMGNLKHSSFIFSRFGVLAQGNNGKMIAFAAIVTRCDWIGECECNKTKYCKTILKQSLNFRAISKVVIQTTTTTTTTTTHFSRFQTTYRWVCCQFAKQLQQFVFLVKRCFLFATEAHLGSGESLRAASVTRGSRGIQS